MSTTFTKQTALLIIDVQKAFDSPQWGQRNNLQAEEQIFLLEENWRRLGFPLIHIQHVSENTDSLFYLDSQTVNFKEKTAPLADELIIKKTVNSAFIGTDLEMRLAQLAIKEIVIIGLTTPHCVSTTTRMSANLGFTTYLISDATAAFELVGPTGQVYLPELVHELSLVTVTEEFAKVITTAQLLKLLPLDSQSD